MVNDEEAIKERKSVNSGKRTVNKIKKCPAIGGTARIIGLLKFLKGWIRVTGKTG